MEGNPTGERRRRLARTAGGILLAVSFGMLAFGLLGGHGAAGVVAAAATPTATPAPPPPPPPPNFPTPPPSQPPATAPPAPPPAAATAPPPAGYAAAPAAPANQGFTSGNQQAAATPTPAATPQASPSATPSPSPTPASPGEAGGTGAVPPRGDQIPLWLLVIVAVSVMGNLAVAGAVLQRRLRSPSAGSWSTE